MTRIIALVTAALAFTVAFPSMSSAARPEPRDRYVVVLEESAEDPGAVAREHGQRHGVSADHVYRGALRGYAGRIPPGRIDAVRADPRVAYVEADRLMHAVAIQGGATWGLDRIDQRSLPLSTSFAYSRTGTGVRAYVVDTGLRPSHADFGGRAVSDRDFVAAPYDNAGKDCNGHGTHVGATIGGATYGVAKGVSLVGIRVLACDGSGLVSEIVAGIDWITTYGQRPAVVNMSLGGGISTALDEAVRRSIGRGFSYAIAAGNSGANACHSSPARVETAMTVSASDRYDRKPSWANFGSCVDWFAPGASITSAWHTSDTSINTISGTSMAAPHAAGTAALYLQSNPGASASTVREALYAKATKRKVGSSSTSNNHLLFTDW